MTMARKNHIFNSTFSLKYLILAPYSSGKQYPLYLNVKTVAPDLIASSQTLARKSLSVLHLQHKNSTSSTNFWHEKLQT
jgi:hypothetical protein